MGIGNWLQDEKKGFKDDFNGNKGGMAGTGIPLTPNAAPPAPRARMPIPGVTGPEDMPSYDTGTTYVPKDQIAQVHEGEAIIPADQNPYKPAVVQTDGEATGRRMPAEVPIHEALASEKEDAAHRGDLHDFGMATIAQNHYPAPVYGGPSRSAVLPGQPIPEPQLAADEKLFNKHEGNEKAQAADEARTNWLRAEDQAKHNIQTARANGDVAGLRTAQQDKEELDKQGEWGQPGSAHSNWLGKVEHVAAKVGNIAGDIVAPGTMANIPGTDLNKNWMQRGQNEQDLGIAQDVAKQGLENRKENFLEEQARGAKNEGTPEQQLIDANRELRQAQASNNPKAIAAAQAQVDDITSVINSKSVADKYQKVGNDIVDVTNLDTNGQAKVVFHGTPEQKLGRSRVISPVDNKEHDYIVDENTGEKLHDLGVVKEPADANAAGDRQMRNAAQSEITKSYSDYNKADKQIKQLSADLQSSKDGNQVASSLAPLEGTLLVTSSAGVRRVNTVELDMSMPGAGSVVRHAEAWLNKKITGGLPDGYVEDMQKLIALYHQTNEQNYKDAVDSANARHGTSVPYGLPKEKETGVAQGAAAKLHKNMKDFKQSTPTKEHGILYTDDGKTWYKEDGSVYKG